MSRRNFDEGTLHEEEGRKSPNTMFSEAQKTHLLYWVGGGGYVVLLLLPWSGVRDRCDLL
jgi:hypothetical protein